MDFNELSKEGKTVIYKESTSPDTQEGWKYWSERVTEDEHIYVFRKIVTFEEAEQIQLALLN